MKHDPVELANFNYTLTVSSLKDRRRLVGSPPLIHQVSSNRLDECLALQLEEEIFRNREQLPFFS